MTARSVSELLGPGKRCGKETSNITDWESLHSDWSNAEVVTQTWYEKKMMEIFATPQESKLKWFNTSNHYRSLQKKRDPSMVIMVYPLVAGLKRYFSVIILRRWSRLFLAAGLIRYINEFILGRYYYWY